MKTSTGGNFLPSHGSISEIPRAKVMQVLYGQPDPTVYSKSWEMPTQADISVDTMYIPPSVYPMGKQNCGCGTGVGLALLPPIAFRAAAKRRRKKEMVRK